MKREPHDFTISLPGKALALLAVVCWLLWSGCEQAQAQAEDRTKWNENTWTAYLCSQNPDWQEQFRTPDGSYVDVLTPTHAIEVDYGPKWKEAVGQALFYAITTEKQPGIILLVRDWDRERVYYLRCLAVCARHGIKLMVVEVR